MRQNDRRKEEWIEDFWEQYGEELYDDMLQ